MEISKEYLDQQFKVIAEQFKMIANQFKTLREEIVSKVELNHILDKRMGSLVTKNGFDKKVLTLATKYDLDVQTRELKQYVHDAFEVQQTYTDERSAELVESMQIEDQLKLHEYWIDKIAKKVDVKLS